MSPDSFRESSRESPAIRIVALSMIRVILAMVAVLLSIMLVRDFLSDRPSARIELHRPEETSPVVPISSGWELKQVTVPILPRGATQTSGRLQIERIYKDYERRGFFKIGLFPKVVVENSVLEIRDPGDSLSVLRSVDQWIRSMGGTNAEMRHFTIRFGVEDLANLEASSLKMLPDSWIGRGCRVKMPDGKWVEAAEVQLVLSGRSAGEVRGLEPSTILISDLFTKYQHHETEE
jgi:hypothetical protein